MIRSSADAVVKANRIANNKSYGIMAEKASQLIVESNEFRFHELAAILMTGDALGIIRDNLFDHNALGILVQEAAKPIIESNKFSVRCNGEEEKKADDYE